jgi:DNA polymerase-3 subunit chi
MKTRLVLHELPGSKRAGELSMLVESLYKQRRKVVIWIEDKGRLKIFDDYLWTFRKLSFVPHAVWTSDMREVDDPVVLVAEPANPNMAGVLVVGDGFPPGDWAATFEEVHDLVESGDDGVKRRAFWESWSRENNGEGGDG